MADTAADLEFGRYLDRTGLDTCNWCGELMPGGEHTEEEGCPEGPRPCGRCKTPTLPTRELLPQTEQFGCRLCYWLECAEAAHQDAEDAVSCQTSEIGDYLKSRLAAAETAVYALRKEGPRAETQKAQAMVMAEKIRAMVAAEVGA